MEIKIDDSEIKKAVSAAILQAMDASKREQLISAAINHLFLETQTSSYNHQKTSKIQQIFNDELYRFASEEIRKQFADNPAIKGRVSALIAAAIDKGFNAENSEMVDRMASLIATALTPRDR